MSIVKKIIIEEIKLAEVAKRLFIGKNTGERHVFEQENLGAIDNCIMEKIRLLMPYMFSQHFTSKLESLSCEHEKIGDASGSFLTGDSFPLNIYQLLATGIENIPAPAHFQITVLSNTYMCGVDTGASSNYDVYSSMKMDSASSKALHEYIQDLYFHEMNFLRWRQAEPEKDEGKTRVDYV